MLPLDGTSEEIIQTLEKYYQKAIGYLKREEHEKVNEIFTFFFETDIQFKEALQKALSPSSSDEDILDPEKLNFITEIQGHLSYYHLNLFNAITDHLMTLYEEGLKQMDTNLENGSRKTFQAQHATRLYQVKLEKLKGPLNTLRGTQYNDLVHNYEVANNRRDENIKKLAKMVIQKEQELRG